MTVIGNRPEWVEAMVACFRIGAVALPCTEQLRPKDLRARMDLAEPRAVVADERDADAVREAGFDGPLLTIPDESLYEGPPAPAADLSAEDPALITFTSGTAGEAKPIRHGQRYLTGQRVQAEHWFGAREGDLAWCTAASGWSKSARNVFIAPWLMGATALLHDARFDPEGRLEVAEREAVNVLCMAPTEYRAVAKRTAPARATRAQARSGGRRAAQPRGRAAVARLGRDRDPRRLRPDRDRCPHRHADRTAGPPRVDGPPPPRLQGLDRRGRAVRGPRDRAHVLPRWPAGRMAHRRPRPPGRGRLPLVRGPHRRRDHLVRLPDRPIRGGVSARLAPGGRRGGRGRGAGRGARLGRARRGRAARRARARGRSSRASCRST